MDNIYDYLPNQEERELAYRKKVRKRTARAYADYEKELEEKNHEFI